MENDFEHISDLRKQLAAAFAQASTRAEDVALADAGDYDEMNDETRKAFRATWDEVIALLREILALPARGARITPKDKAFYDNLALAISFRPFVIYDHWSVRPDVTDDEIAAAEQAIAAGNVNALENFRNPQERFSFVGSLDADAQNFTHLLGNLQYLCVVLAHYAKNLNSYDAGRYFLMAASQMQKMRKMACPHLTDEQLAEFIDNLQKGFEELAIAADYATLDGDWDAFSSREGAKIESQLDAAQEATEAK